jgi:meso-butanediol dehydrogenase / (S,S)-butanediol dehydrogenase / diacetyl reductase
LVISLPRLLLVSVAWTVVCRGTVTRHGDAARWGKEQGWMGRLDGKIALISGTARAWVEAAVAEFGGVDILYNNASALRNGALMELTDDDWHFTVRNELDIVWFSVRAAWPELVKRGGGSIVNVASIAAKLGARFVGQVPHGSAKGGVLAMTKHLCAAGGAHGIRANAILPGLIYTPETARFIDDLDGPLPGILAKIPLGRYGRADEVAKLAAFLASDDAAFITGAEIAIDGGDGSVAA